MANDIKTEDIFEVFTQEEKRGHSSAKSHEGSEKKGTPKKKKKRAHPWAFPLGLAVTVLSIIGIVTILVAGIGSVKKAIVKVKNIDEYNKMLVPVVMNDPNTFDDLSKADMGQLLDISIWAILKSDLEPDTYPYNDSGMIIPEEDIAKQFKELFGDKISPVHATVTGFGYEFTYDAASKCYTIPLTGVAPVYTPNVISVEKKSNTIILTVAYLAANGWAQDSDGKMVAPAPDKYMKITLRQGSSGYYISAIQATSTPETAATVPVTVIVEPTENTTQPPASETTNKTEKSEEGSSTSTTTAQTTKAEATASTTAATTTQAQTSIQ